MECAPQAKCDDIDYDCVLMNRIGMSLTVTLFLFGCSPSSSGSDGGMGGGTGGGGGSSLGAFALTDLDPAALDATYFAMAVDPMQERVGVAYFSNRKTQTMAGRDDYDIKYVEWKKGVISPIQTVRFVQQIIGISLVFDPTTGEPIMAYLGGPDGFVMGDSVFWFQHEAVINRRSGGSTWTETIVASTGNQITCGNVVSDRGFLVGLWSTIAIDSTGKMYLAYRDAHAGQFPFQDWNGSDLELWEGPIPPTTGTCLAQGGEPKSARGGHNQLVIGPDNEPAIVHDQMFNSADSNGVNVVFQFRKAGVWSTPALKLTISNTQTGPSLAYDSQEGYGIAVVDRGTDQLSYINSLDGTNWNAVDPVFGAGAGGWYPSLAMDPINHEPAIAFYVCSPKSGATETGCLNTEDKLMVTQRIADTWREVLVDANGGYHPKIGFFASGKRVIAYRTPPAVDSATGQTITGVGALKLAVER